MNEIGFCNEYTALKLRHAALKERVASQIELYTHLVEVVGPNLKASYMMLVGQLEHRIFELKTEVSRWKRRFALRQQFLNRGEKPDLVGIEAELDEEFAEYLAEIKKHIEEIRKASDWVNSESFSDEEATQLRTAYLDAVKKLHPDINHDLPQAAANLWNQIQDAYSKRNWTMVRLLSSIVDSVVSGDVDFKPSPGGIEELRDACGRLEAKSREISEMTDRVRSTVPFTYEVLLEDKNLVAEKQGELKAQIDALEDCIRGYERIWNDGE